MYTATDQDANCSICRGGYNLVGKLSDYNGEENDPLVRVDLYPSPGIAELYEVDCTENTWSEDSCWQREDPWMFDEQYITGDGEGVDVGTSQFHDPSAFVADGWLVMELPDSTPLGLVSVHEEIPKVVRIAMVRSETPKASTQECPQGMVFVEGKYCPKVEHHCKRYLDPPGRYERFRCAERAVVKFARA